MTLLNSALLAACEHYADLLATPHTDIRAWRRRVLRAKAAVAVLSRAAEAEARERAPRWSETIN